MGEDDAISWLRATFGDADVERLSQFVSLLLAEAEHQNLISPSTKEQVWARHIADSAQLVPLAKHRGGAWLDIGSGAGLPGIVVAILRAEPVCLVEPRVKRVQFLRHVADALALSHVSVIQAKVEQVSIQASVISARAVASLPELFAGAQGCSSPETVWLLPKGRSADAELATARNVTGEGVFHVEQSRTDSSSFIIVGTKVARR